MKTYQRRLAVGRRLLTGVYVLIILMMILSSPDHSVDPRWSLHASVHLFQGLSWVIGLCAINLIIVRVPLARNERWAWWAVLLSGIVVFGGYFAPAIYSGFGVGIIDAIGLGLLAIVHALGLALAFIRTNHSITQELGRQVFPAPLPVPQETIRNRKRL